MTVRVQFFAQLRDAIGVSELEVQMSEGSTTQQMLDAIYAQSATLRKHDATILLAVGVEFVPRDYVLKDADEVAVMPPVQGG